jgi:tetratricopeptide (TPR) repeat protein
MANFKFIRVGLLAGTLLISFGCSPQAKESRYLRRGKAQLDKKDYSRAVLEFRNATKTMPKDPEAYYQLGLAYLGMAAPANAVGQFRKTLELNPKHAGAQLKLAELMAASRNQDLIKQAADLLHSVLAASPDNTEAIDSMAITEWQLGRREDAEKRLEDALQKFPAHLQSAVELARLKLSKRDLAGAEEVLERAAQSAPQSAAAAVALAELYAIAKQPDKTERELRRALQLDPHNPTALLRLASLQMGLHRPEEAEQIFRQIAALPDPRFRSAHAMFLYATGKQDSAIAELEKLVKDNPGDRTTRGRLVAAYFKTNQLKKANQILTGALKKNPKDVDALFQESELDLKSGKVTEADQDLRQVIGFMPNSAPAHSALAAVHRAQRLPHSEQQELSEALRLDPGLLEARLRLANSFLEQGAAKAALDALDQAPAAQKRALAWFVERGWAMLAVGNTKELRVALDQALRVNRAPDLLLQDAALKMQEHDYAGARADSDEVLRKNPEEVRAARILASSYVAQREPEEAGKRLLELSSAHPNSAPLQQLQGEWYLANGKLPEARQAFEAAKAADLKFVQADLSLADLDRREKHIEAARQRLNAIIATDPQNTAALLLSAELEQEAANRDTAIKRYRAVLAIDSSNLMALNNLAYDLALQNPDEALPFAQQAAQIAPENAPVADTLGWVYYRKGIYRAAVQYLKTAVSKESTPRRQFHLAMCYIKLGDRDVGQKLLATALQADPSLPKTELGW